MGYQHLNKTAQNLRDKLAHVEKTTMAISTRITDEIRQQQQESQTCNRPNSTSGSTPTNSSFISTRATQDQNANYSPTTQVDHGNANTGNYEQDLEYLSLLKAAQNQINQETGVTGKRILLRERRGKPEYPGKNLSVETSD